jgi:beta-glucosidase
MPWENKVKAILEGYLGGQAAGGAIADILFGDVNPSGKLAETFPVKLSHNPSYLNFPGEEDKVEYKEGLFVGYRYYDKTEIEPLYPFGHGLSYTNFEYTGISVDKKELTDSDSLKVTVTVKNTGTVAGKEIVQLYIKDVASSVIRPIKELKGFEKIMLQPCEEKSVSFTLDKRAFAYYNTEIKDWHVESGDFVILVGSSSKDIKLQETVYIKSTVEIKKKFTRNSTLGDIMLEPKGAEFAKSIIKEMFGGQSDNTDTLGIDMATMMKDFVLRSMVTFSGGKFSEEIMEELLNKLNS